MTSTFLDEAGLVDLASGAAVLGSGGGGDPYVGRLLAQRAIELNGPVEVVGPQDLPDDAFVLLVGMMGAPSVIVEKLPSGSETREVIAAVEHAVGRKVTHIAGVEVGGINSMIPIAAAAINGLPLVDADGMGRAFPELQMLLPTLDRIATTPMALADEKGNVVTLRTHTNAWAERLARTATVEMGASATMAMYPMTGAQVRQSLIPGTLGLAREIGRALRECRDEHGDPAAALRQVMSGVELCRGKITDVTRRTEGGFMRGTATLLGLDEWQGSQLQLEFQNEHLVARRDGEVVASVPDLICIVDAADGTPVTTESLRYGFRVAVIGAPCHARWRTPEGLALVGPGYFGYDHDFRPVEELAGGGPAAS